MRIRSEPLAESGGAAATSNARAQPPAIDYGPLAERLGYVLRRAQLAVFQDFIAAFAAHDILPAQYSVLTLIEHNAGLTQTRLAQALGIKKTNLVAMIDTLEERGLVRRQATSTDRRTRALALTRAGAGLMPALHRLSAAHEARVMVRLGAGYAGLYVPLIRLAGLERDHAPVRSPARRARRAR
jgi:DNA-binding MarR family transcriptional regulator